MARPLGTAAIVLALVVWTILLLGTTASGYPQLADSSCQIDSPPPQATVPYAGAVRQVNLRADQWKCVSNPESKVDWVSVSVIPAGTNSAQALQYAVQPNLSFHPRTTSISIGSQTFGISQDAGPRPGIAGPSSLEWEVPLGAKKVDKKVLCVGSDDPGLDFTATIGREAISWLSVRKSGADGRSFKVAVDIRNLKPGTYAGRILVHAAGARNDPLAVPVNLKILP